MNRDFHRIYWSKKFDWKHYAKLYDKYCKEKGNYYQLSSDALVNAVEIKENFSCVDLACGTGAFTAVLLKKFPKIKITAIDISEESLEYYKNNFKHQISKKQIHVICGNAEKIHEFINKKMDLVFISSSLWDMDIEVLFRNLPKIMSEKAKIITNLPSLTVGENQGFIYEIEKYFAENVEIKHRYRKIMIPDLIELLEKNLLKLAEKKRYEFKMSKENIVIFFDVLKYRYPFIFFSEDIPYEKSYKMCSELFDKFLERIPDEGLKETGYSIVVIN